MILPKGVTDKDSSIKSQLLLSEIDEKLSGERVWRSEGYFSDIRPELNLQKKKHSRKYIFLREPLVSFDY